MKNRVNSRQKREGVNTCPICSGKIITVLPIYRNRVLINGEAIICHNHECGRINIQCKDSNLNSPLEIQLELFRILEKNSEKRMTDFTGWVVVGDEILKVSIEDPCGLEITRLPDKWRLCARLPMQGEQNKFAWPDIQGTSEGFVLKV